MKIKLPDKWKKKLSLLPETSMGAQHVDIILQHGRIVHDVPVFNGEDCESTVQFDVNDISNVRLTIK